MHFLMRTAHDTKRHLSLPPRHPRSSRTNTEGGGNIFVTKLTTGFETHMYDIVWIAQD